MRAKDKTMFSVLVLLMLFAGLVLEYSHFRSNPVQDIVFCAVSCFAYFAAGLIKEKSWKSVPETLFVCWAIGYAALWVVNALFDRWYSHRFLDIGICCINIPLIAIGLWILWAADFASQKSVCRKDGTNLVIRYREELAKLWGTAAILCAALWLISQYEAVVILILAVTLVISMHRFGHPVKHLLAVLGVLAVSALSVFLYIQWGGQEPFFLKRIEAWLNLNAYQYDVGYAYSVVKDIVNNSTVFGIGFDKIYIDIHHNGTVFSMVLQQFGWVGFGMLTSLMGMFLFWLIRITKALYHSNNQFGFYYVLGVTLHMSTAIGYNLLCTFGILPYGTIRIPLVDAPYSATIFEMIEMGIVLAILRYETSDKEKEMPGLWDCILNWLCNVFTLDDDFLEKYAEDDFDEDDFEEVALNDGDKSTDYEDIPADKYFINNSGEDIFDFEAYFNDVYDSNKILNGAEYFKRNTPHPVNRDIKEEVKKEMEEEIKEELKEEIIEELVLEYRNEFKEEIKQELRDICRNTYTAKFKKVLLEEIEKEFLVNPDENISDEKTSDEKTSDVKTSDVKTSNKKTPVEETLNEEDSNEESSKEDARDTEFSKDE